MTDRSQQENDDESSIDRRSADIGIICTHGDEIGPLLKLLDRQRKYIDQGAIFRGGFLDETIRVAVAEAGAGFARHRSVAQTLLDEHHPTWILSVGFGSALIEELNAGDVSLANEICDTHGNSLTVKCPIPESKRVLVRKHVVADTHPHTTADKVALAETTAAAVVDTTGLAVAQVCADVPDDAPRTGFLSMRVIIDTASETVPSNAVPMLFEPSDVQQNTVIEKLKKRFKRDPEFDPWKSRANEAAANMNRFLVSVIRRLAAKIDRARI
jgi:adenosylhomocysteine nucleosidase